MQPQLNESRLPLLKLQALCVELETDIGVETATKVCQRESSRLLTCSAVLPAAVTSAL